MDQAKQNMEQDKYDLQNFSRELNDVNMACNLNINTNDFLVFADYLLDGFVIDWMVQNRINKAKQQVREEIRRTENIIDHPKDHDILINIYVLIYIICNLISVKKIFLFIELTIRWWKLSISKNIEYDSL